MDALQSAITQVNFLNLNATDSFFDERRGSPDRVDISTIFDQARRIVADPEALPGTVNEMRAMARFWRDYCHDNGMDDIVPETGTPTHGWLFQTPQ